jgi:UDP-N-acetylmuramoylalanine--D-glutamate ligase
MEAYTAAKARILAFQSPLDWIVLGRDDPVAWSLSDKVKGQLFSFGFTPLPVKACGAFLYQNDICVCTEPGKHQATWVMKSSEVALRGEHNLLNVMAACTIAAVAGLPVEAMRAGVRGFTGVPHRLEFVRSWGGADWFNDSSATAPERTMAAIRLFQEPLILLAGGRDKKLPWDEFARLASQRVEHLIVFGEAAGIILQAVESEQNTGLKVTRCKGLREAVDHAAQAIKPGVVVLLSPGGTSFDEFKDFEERGECFARWVRELP